MSPRQKNQMDGFFQNTVDFFQHYRGKIIPAHEIQQHDFIGLNIAIIGIDQHTAQNLHRLTPQAHQVLVFQISPAFILPENESSILKLISHPLIIKNRRLFSQRIKAMIAIRHLESKIQDQWLKRQLMPNPANKQKIFFKSDHYYRALQQANCQLITWPIEKITDHAIQTIQDMSYPVDVIISTYAAE